MDISDWAPQRSIKKKLLELNQKKIRDALSAQLKASNYKIAISLFLNFIWELARVNFLTFLGMDQTDRGRGIKLKLGCGRANRRPLDCFGKKRADPVGSNIISLLLSVNKAGSAMDPACFWMCCQYAGESWACRNGRMSCDSEEGAQRSQGDVDTM